jgi:hypothetical protein
VVGSRPGILGLSPYAKATLGKRHHSFIQQILLGTYVTSSVDMGYGGGGVQM